MTQDEYYDYREDNLSIPVTISIATCVVAVPYLIRYVEIKKNNLRRYIESTPENDRNERWIEQQRNIIELIEDDIRTISLV